MIGALPVFAGLLVAVCCVGFLRVQCGEEFRAIARAFEESRRREARLMDEVTCLRSRLLKLESEKREGPYR